MSLRPQRAHLTLTQCSRQDGKFGIRRSMLCAVIFKNLCSLDKNVFSGFANIQKQSFATAFYLKTKQRFRKNYNSNHFIDLDSMKQL